MVRFVRNLRINAAIPAIGILGLLASSVVPTTVYAQPLIRDAEIENTIRDYATPVLQAAGLEPAHVRIYIVNDKRLNAYVAGGQKIFITTALLQNTEHPGQLTGVLAHEIGHIAGGHLARLEGALRDAQTTALIGTLLGVAVGALAGEPEAAAAASSAGTHVAHRSLLKYSRVQERSADQAALRYLDLTGQSAQGLLEFLETLSDQELLVVSDRTQRNNSYTVTHPLTRDRIAFVRNHVERSRHSDAPVTPKQKALHLRIRAKLDGFLDPPARTFSKYRANDRSLTARYARAIAFYRQAHLDDALRLIDGLIAEHPEDPYFQELRGQVLFENGRLDDALPAYDRAVQLLPNEPLLLVSRAHVQIERDRPELLKSALASLKEAIGADPNMPFAWRLAAIAYGRSGDIGMSHLSSAEYNLSRGDHKAARSFAERAKASLKRGSSAWLRAEDIIQAANRGRRPERG